MTKLRLELCPGWLAVRLDATPRFPVSRKDHSPALTGEEVVADPKKARVLAFTGIGAYVAEFNGERLMIVPESSVIGVVREEET